MGQPETEWQSESQELDQLKYIQPKSNDLFVLPLVRKDGHLSIPAEIMTVIWHQIVMEGKVPWLFYDGCVSTLKDWIDYIYDPNNFVAIVLDDTGHVFHIAWINKFYRRHGFLHHCALGQYNRKSWPTLRKYWASLKDQNGQQIIKTLLGVTPVNNPKAIKLVKLLGWTILGEVPGICYIKSEDRYEKGVISYVEIGE